MKCKFGKLSRKVVLSYIKHYGYLHEISSCQSLYNYYESQFGPDLVI
jgi:hypothetical protein